MAPLSQTLEPPGNPARFRSFLAHEIEASIFMPMNMGVPGQLEAVFERIAETWGELDFLVHSIAFSPKDTLPGRVTDAPRDGFLATMDMSCWSFIRMAHLAEPLMKNGGTLFTMTYYGSQAVVENYNIMGVAKAALESAVRYMAAELGPKGIRVHAISRAPSPPARPRAYPSSTSFLPRPSRRRRRASSLASTTSASRPPSSPTTLPPDHWPGAVRRCRVPHHRLREGPTRSDVELARTRLEHHGRGQNGSGERRPLMGAELGPESIRVPGRGV